MIWKQIIDKANEVDKGIIFVNDDKKEDWWLIFRGKTLGPRPELITEFLGKCGQNFYMYQADRFLEFAADHLKQEIAPESMDEIRDLRRYDHARRAELIKLREKEALLRMRNSEVHERMASSRAQMDYLQKKIAGLQHGQNVYNERLAASGGQDHESLEKFLEYKKSVESTEMELQRIQQELAFIEKEYAVAQSMVSEYERMTEQERERGRW